MKKDYSQIIEPLLKDGYCIQKSISGYSMLPAIPDQAVACIEPILRGRVHIGDVILFKSSDNQTKIHRVAMRFRRNGVKWMQTWGDNCPLPDSPARIGNVIGRVTALKANNGWRPLENGVKRYLILFTSRYGLYYVKKAGIKIYRHLKLLLFEQAK